MPLSAALFWLDSAATDFVSERIVHISAQVFNCLLFLYHLSCSLGYCDAVTAVEPVGIISMALLFLYLSYLFQLVYHIWNIKLVLKIFKPWYLLCFIVDSVYLFFYFLTVLLIQLGYLWAGFFILLSLTLALGIRICSDSKFIIWKKQERRLMESMKSDSGQEPSQSSRPDDIYREIYDRLTEYFDNNKPYLNGELALSDLAKELYCNKLYLSRAISLCSGKNFCQFVNYYRVNHSIEAFRENPYMKVHELSTESGFNSIVSYNMAFRLFMGENPSEWCRKEKAKLIKK